MREVFSDKHEAPIISDEAYFHALEADALPIEIISNERLKYGDSSTRISPAATALNGLLRCRDRFAGSQELRDEAGYRYTKTAFANDLKLIDERLGKLTQEEALLTSGRSRNLQYQLSPKFDFVDRRDVAADDPALRRHLYGLTQPVPSLEVYDGHYIRFETPQDRRRLVSAILRDTADHPALKWLGSELLKGSPLPELPFEEVKRNFAHLERAIVAYLQPEQTQATQAAILDGALAYQELLVSTLDHIHYFAARLGASTFGYLRDDLFQEAVAGVMDDIMTFSQDWENRNGADGYFYKKLSIAAHGAMRHRLKRENWRRVGVHDEKVRILDRIPKAEETLRHKLNREPSPAEIAEHLEIDIELADECMYLLESPAVSMDMPSVSYGKDMRFSNDDIEGAIDRLHKNHLVDLLFTSDQLDEREKIMLSTYFGVYTRHLNGAIFYKLAPVEPCFTYPDTEEEFYAAVYHAVGLPSICGSLLGVNPVHLSNTLNSILPKAKQVLKTYEY